MIKVIAASALALGMATSAFAQAGTGSSSDGGAPGGQPVAPAIQTTPGQGSSTSTDSMSTNSTTPEAKGLSGTSAAGSNENCAPGTPGVGTQGAPSNSDAKKEACSN